MPNNIKIFACRVLHNALLTMENLEQRKGTKNGWWCPLCGLQIETLSHDVGVENKDRETKTEQNSSMYYIQ